LDFAYPPNLEVNKQVNLSWKDYIKQPELLARIAKLEMPALFVYGKNDIRPSWPIEQVATLLPNAELILFNEADHHLWQTSEEEKQLLKNNLSNFIQKV